MPRLVPLVPRFGAERLPEQFALVDDEDYERVAAVRWREENGLAVAANQRPRLTMHRFVLEAPAGQDVFHRNRDTLDNRRENLLLCQVAAARSLRRSALKDVLQAGAAGWIWVGPFQRLISPERLRAVTDRLRALGQAAAAPAPAPGRIAAGAGRGLRRVRFKR